MSSRLHRVSRFHAPMVVCLLAVWAVGPAFAQVSGKDSSTSAPATSPASTLASRVPSDAAIYLEIRGLQRFLGSGAGAGMTAAVLRVLEAAPTTQPAQSGGQEVGSRPRGTEGVGGPRELFAAAVGLPPSSKAIQMLFSGSVAFAADGWSGLSDAVLVAWPADPKALEATLAAKRLPETASAPVRRYALANGHELACDGRTALIGRVKRTSLYTRTLDLLSQGGDSLAETPEFRERTGAIASNAQMIAYFGRARLGDVEGHSPLSAWWPDAWPRVKTLATGLVWDAGGVHVKFSARLDPEGQPLTRSEPPVQILRRLPASVVAVWTTPIDYVDEFRRMRRTRSLETEGFHFDSLETGLMPGIIEQQILGHLVGDTVLVLDQVSVRPADAEDDKERLTLPVGAALVETDDPDAVAAALPLVADNFVRLINTQASPGQAVSLEHEPLVAGGPTLWSIPIGRSQLAQATRCDLMHALEVSWTVVDRWLVVATNPQTVRRLVEVRGKGGSLLDVGELDQMVERVVQYGGQPRRVLFARPKAAAGMIDSWLTHIARHHPEMLQAQWWERLLRRQRAMGKQVEILARPDNGTVEVVEALPNGPARGRLMPGDRILAVDGNRIDDDDPLQSLRELVAQREQPTRVVFLVRRGDQEEEIELPMPEDQVEGGLRSPVELFRRLSVACRVFGSTSYVLWQPRPDIVDARIDLRYVVLPRASQPARTQPEKSAPAQSGPATAPAATQPATQLAKPVATKTQPN